MQDQQLTVIGQAVTPQAQPQPLVMMPVMRAADFLERRKVMYEMLKEAMIEGVDYGIIPGTPKPSLWKPGAEKLLQLFGLRAIPVPVEIVEDWGGKDQDDGEPFLYYKYRADLYHGDALVVSYTGLCHSRETKYRYRWVPEHEVPKHLDKSQLEVRVGHASEYAFAVRKAETTGKYGKPAEYWQQFTDAIRAGTARRFDKMMGVKHMDAYEIDLSVFRIPNPEVADLAHTLSAMAQKRAIVGGTRYATNASDLFDLDDETGEDGPVIDGQYSVAAAQEQATQQAKIDRVTKTGGKSKRTEAEHQADIASAWDDSQEKREAKAKNGGKLNPVNALRQAYGKMTEGKGVPPSDERYRGFLDLVASLGLDAESLSQQVFEKPPGGLDAAQIDVMMDNAALLEQVG